MDQDQCQEQCQDLREPSLGGRGMMKCTCEEAHMRYQDLLEPHRDPSWRMPSFTELSIAARDYKQQAKLCQACSTAESI